MKPSADYIEGLRAAHRLLAEKHQAVYVELHNLPAGFLGRPTQRHRELVGASRALADLSTALVDEVLRVDPTER